MNDCRLASSHQGNYREKVCESSANINANVKRNVKDCHSINNHTYFAVVNKIKRLVNYLGYFENTEKIEHIILKHYFLWPKTNTKYRTTHDSFGIDENNKPLKCKRKQVVHSQSHPLNYIHWWFHCGFIPFKQNHRKHKISDKYSNSHSNHPPLLPPPPPHPTCNCTNKMGAYRR